MTPLTCKEFVELVTEYLEGTLPAPEKLRFEEHLSGCRGCTTYLHQMRQTLTLTGRLSEEALLPEIKKDMLNLFRDWKNN